MMDIFNFDNIEDAEMMTIDNKTKNFCIGLSARITESREEEVYNFFEKELKINIISNEEHHDFNFNEGSGLESYISIDTKHYDVSFILDRTFKDVVEANAYIEEKVSNSRYIGKNFFSEIILLDMDRVNLLLNLVGNEEKRTLDLKKSIKSEMESKIEELKSKYSSNPMALQIIQNIYVKV